jgi:predicted metalloprotease
VEWVRAETHFEECAMRLKDYRRSGNVEDRRGMSLGGRGAAIGGGGIVLVLVLSLLTGQNPLTVLEQVEQVGGAGGATQIVQV